MGKVGEDLEPRTKQIRLETSVTSNPGSSTRDQFLIYSKELDEKHDLRDLLSKLTRDITSESKRIIFQLHRYTTLKTEQERNELLMDAKKRLDILRRNHFFHVAKKLSSVDQNLFRYPVKFGLEEYIEAWSFSTYLHSERLLEYTEVKEKFKYDPAEFTESADNDSATPVQLFVQPVDFLLGLSDIGGELMRFAINQASAGNFDSVEKTLNFMRSAYSSFLSFSPLIDDRDWPKKIVTFEQSLTKVEMILYKSKLRLTELPENVNKEIKMKMFSSDAEKHSMLL